MRKEFGGGIDHHRSQLSLPKHQNQKKRKPNQETEEKKVTGSLKEAEDAKQR